MWKFNADAPLFGLAAIDAGHHGCSTRISAGGHSIHRLGHLVGTIQLLWIARFLQSN
jgi:hypothetical protein